MPINQNIFKRTKQRFSENCHVENVFLTCTRGPGPPSHCKAAVSAENDDVNRSNLSQVSHLGDLLEPELVGGELIGEAGRLGGKLLGDVPHTIRKLKMTTRSIYVKLEMMMKYDLNDFEKNPTCSQSKPCMGVNEGHFSGKYS